VQLATMVEALERAGALLANPAERPRTAGADGRETYAFPYDALTIEEFDRVALEQDGDSQP